MDTLLVIIFPLKVFLPRKNHKPEFRLWGHTADLNTWDTRIDTNNCSTAHLPNCMHMSLTYIIFPGDSSKAKENVGRNKSWPLSSEWRNTLSLSLRPFVWKVGFPWNFITTLSILFRYLVYNSYTGSVLCTGMTSTEHIACPQRYVSQYSYLCSI